MVMRIGFELETGIKRNSDYRELANTLNWVVSGDGSVHTTKRNAYAIELKSRVYQFGKEMGTLVKDFNAVKKRIAETNSSMGLHIHLSFSRKQHYYKLCSWDFVDYFQTEYAKKFTKPKEVSRMNNNYCKFYRDKRQFQIASAVQLASNTKNERYWAVNFNAYPLYKTIEFRIFPSTKKVKEFKAYIRFVKYAVYSFLKADIDTTIREKAELTEEEIQAESVKI
jgi:hypothetical protein